MTNLSYSEGRTVATRVYRRSDRHLPFMPYGLIPLLGLLVVFWMGMGPFARQIIEQRAIQSAESTLAANGADWASAHVSGQWVWLEGKPPSRMEGEQLIALVRAAQTPTWLGSATPVTRVYAQFGSGVVMPSAIRKPEWTYRLSDGVLRLEGIVPDEVTRSSLVAAAESKINPPRLASIADVLDVTHVDDNPEYTEVALHAIDAVSRCDRGVAVFLNEEFSLKCELPESRAAALQQHIASPLSVGRLGNIDILPNEAVATCETSLADLLGTAHIQFAPSSAQIDARSSSLLQSVADAAKACPGTLRIEGHTDSMGTANANELLGDARAEAVRDALIVRGVPADRLRAEGFGARRPIDDNSTAEGRAHNRRIEIRVVRASD
ncbi:OmpA family protein [Hyphomonas sp.]|uniref:OmpA family protein n=1 Tax=Hyphomonas sp. TaxID=87 RepID=UPI003D2E38C6